MRVAIVLLLGEFLVGVACYMAIEGYSRIEAFYMTVITISTVGFTEVELISSDTKHRTGIMR